MFSAGLCGCDHRWCCVCLSSALAAIFTHSRKAQIHFVSLFFIRASIVYLLDSINFGSTSTAVVCYVRVIVMVHVYSGFLGNPMEGVGEDERAYNYICNLDKVNLGGPGWFNDVFKVQIIICTYINMHI